MVKQGGITVSKKKTTSPSDSKTGRGDDEINKLPEILSALINQPLINQLSEYYLLRFRIVTYLFNKCLDSGKLSPQTHKTKNNSPSFDTNDPDTYVHLLSTDDRKLWGQLKIFEANLVHAMNLFRSLPPVNLSKPMQSDFSPFFEFPLLPLMTTSASPLTPASESSRVFLRYFTLTDDGTSATVIYDSLYSNGFTNVTSGVFCSNFLDSKGKRITDTPRDKICWVKNLAGLYYLVHILSENKIISVPSQIWKTVADCFSDKEGRSINTSSANAQFQKGCKNSPALDILVDDIKNGISGISTNKKIN